MKKIAKYLVVFFILIALYCLFAVLSCMLPDRAVKRHVEKAAVTLSMEGNYPRALIDEESCRRDNFTDALILNQIHTIDRTHPVRSAAAVTRMNTMPMYDQTGALYKLTQHDTTLVPIDYARYWHGSTFLFRIVLAVTSYTTLQRLMSLTIALLFALFICCYYPRAGLWKTLVWVVSWVLVNGFATQFSMQFFPVWALSLAASILVIRAGPRTPSLGMIFFVTASLTCYFDLLTTPVLTLGWPLLVWLSLYDSKEQKMAETIQQIALFCLLWSVGYALTFATKWLIGTIVLGENVFGDASGAAIRHITAEEHTRWDTIVWNVKMLPLDMVCLSLIFFAGISLFRFCRSRWKMAVLYLAVATGPLLWYMVLYQHDYLHGWFTYRLLAVSLAALFLSLLSWNRDTGRPLANKLAKE